MPPKTIVRGDAYAIRRPLFSYVLTQPNLTPFPLNGCTVRTTYKTVATAPTADPADASAAIRHFMVIDPQGVVTASSGLVLGEMVGNAFVARPASDGKFIHRLTAAESRLLPVGTPLLGDVEVIDANGEPTTFLFEDGLLVREGYTNRTTDV